MYTKGYKCGPYYLEKLWDLHQTCVPIMDRCINEWFKRGLLAQLSLQWPVGFKDPLSWKIKRGSKQLTATLATPRDHSAPHIQLHLNGLNWHSNTAWTRSPDQVWRYWQILMTKMCFRCSKSWQDILFFLFVPEVRLTMTGELHLPTSSSCQTTRRPVPGRLLVLRSACTKPTWTCSR